MILLPYWLLRLLPMWDYICSRCRKEVEKHSHKCPYCGEHYGVPVRVPPKVLKDTKALEDYVHKHVFPKVSASQREYLRQYFTIIFKDGFESGNTNAWNILSGVPVVVSTQKHHGTYSCQTGSGDYVGETFAVQTTVFARFYLRVDALPTNGTGFIFFNLRGNGDLTLIATLQMWRTAAAILQLRLRRLYPADVTNTYNYSFVIDKWYALELKFVKAAGTGGEYRGYLDGVTVITDSGLDTSGSPDADTIRVGQITSSYAVTNWIDDAVVGDAYNGPEPADNVYIVFLGKP